MNLPYPFDNASGVQINLDGSINLIDHQGKPLARLPLITAFELSMGAEGLGDGRNNRHRDGSGHGFGSEYGHGHRIGSGTGYGVGYGGTDVDGSGRGKDK